jgi:hypothetical protein
MNADHLRKNVGERLRLRPYPQRVESYGSGVSVLSSGGPSYQKNVVLVDYDWVLEAVDEKTKEVTLTCPFTGHQVTLGADNVREYRTPHFLMLKCQLILEGDQVRVEPL